MEDREFSVKQFAGRIGPPTRVRVTASWVGWTGSFSGLSEGKKKARMMVFFLLLERSFSILAGR